MSAGGFAFQESHTIKYDVTDAVISHTEMQHVAETMTSRTVLYVVQRSSGSCVARGLKPLLRQLSTHNGRRPDLSEPVSVSHPNKILKSKQLGHLSRRIIPDSLENELALADLG